MSDDFSTRFSLSHHFQSVYQRQQMRLSSHNPFQSDEIVLFKFFNFSQKSRISLRCATEVRLEMGKREGSCAGFSEDHSNGSKSVLD